MEKILSAEEFREVWKQFDSEILMMENYAKYLLEKQAEYICKNEMFEFAGSIQLSITQASNEFIKNIEL